jgi:hypothetical protein
MMFQDAFVFDMLKTDEMHVAPVRRFVVVRPTHRLVLGEAEAEAGPDKQRSHPRKGIVQMDSAPLRLIWMTLNSGN